jgi:hypothetical protein
MSDNSHRARQAPLPKDFSNILEAPQITVASSVMPRVQIVETKVRCSDPHVSYSSTYNALESANPMSRTRRTTSFRVAGVSDSQSLARALPRFRATSSVPNNREHASFVQSLSRLQEIAHDYSPAS